MQYKATRHDVPEKNTTRHTTTGHNTTRHKPAHTTTQHTPNTTRQHYPPRHSTTRHKTIQHNTPTRTTTQTDHEGTQPCRGEESDSVRAQQGQERRQLGRLTMTGRNTSMPSVTALPHGTKRRIVGQPPHERNRSRATVLAYLRLEPSLT